MKIFLGGVFFSKGNGLRILPFISKMTSGMCELEGVVIHQESANGHRKPSSFITFTSNNIMFVLNT